MANSWKQTIILPVTTAVEASAADIFTWIMEHPFRVTDMGVLVTSVVATDTTATVVALDATLTSAGASRDEKGTVTIPDATAIGTEISLLEQPSTPFVPFSLDEGDTLIIEHKTAGADAGTETGDYYVILYGEIVPDGAV